MKIALGTDHAGFVLKSAVIDYLSSRRNDACFKIEILKKTTFIQFNQIVFVQIHALQKQAGHHFYIFRIHSVQHISGSFRSAIIYLIITQVSKKSNKGFQRSSQDKKIKDWG